MLAENPAARLLDVLGGCGFHKPRYVTVSCQGIDILDGFSLYNAGLLLLAVATSVVLIVGSFYVFRRVSRM